MPEEYTKRCSGERIRMPRKLKRKLPVPLGEPKRVALGTHNFKILQDLDQDVSHFNRRNITRQIRNLRHRRYR